MRRLTILPLDTCLWLLGKGCYLILYLLGWRFIGTAGRFAGDVIYSLSRTRRETTEEELSVLFGNRFARRRIKDITRRSFENNYGRQIETIFFGALNEDRINKIMDVEGLEYVDMALLKGKGVILLLSHFGSFLLPLPFLGYRGYRVNQVTGKQLHTSLIAERTWTWRKKRADRLPVNFIQADSFFRPVYRALMNNEVVAMAFDGRDGSKWVTTDFFERKAQFSTGPFGLARRTGATIIPTFIIRGKNNSHKLILESPFRLVESNDTRAALSNDTRRFAEKLAKYVGKYPCHYGMVLYKERRKKEMGIDDPLFVDA
jgi:KDO2-lipid IV(A) lauroyltransferase